MAVRWGIVALVFVLATSGCATDRHVTSPPATSPPATSPPATSPPTTDEGSIHTGPTGAPPSTRSSDTSSSATGPPRWLLPSGRQLTPQGLWWGVDSTAPMSEAALANVRGWYRGGQVPAVWGRYLSGHYGLQPGELDFARDHRIYVYLLVPDANCSVCAGGGDLCGNDRTSGQAEQDAREALRSAQRLHLPPGTMLWKDIEQIGSCTGELTAEYLHSWYRAMRGTPYRAGFYGNAFVQSYDFVRAYCQAVREHPAFAHQVLLADDEPEPAISAPPQTVGPANAPAFHPDTPHCAPVQATVIWQYGESTSDDNSTDVDEVRPGAPGLLAPDGSATS